VNAAVTSSVLYVMTGALSEDVAWKETTCSYEEMEG